MNYAKLTLSVTAGILLAAAIIVAIIEVPEYQRQQRIRARYARAGEQSCLEVGCPEGAYARALKSVGRDRSKIPAAAQVFCIETAWKGASEERQPALIAQCEKETSGRLDQDVN